MYFISARTVHHYASFLHKNVIITKWTAVCSIVHELGQLPFLFFRQSTTGRSPIFLFLRRSHCSHRLRIQRRLHGRDQIYESSTVSIPNSKPPRSRKPRTSQLPPPNRTIHTRTNNPHLLPLPFFRLRLPQPNPQTGNIVPMPLRLLDKFRYSHFPAHTSSYFVLGEQRRDAEG